MSARGNISKSPLSVGGSLRWLCRELPPPFRLRRLSSRRGVRRARCGSVGIRVRRVPGPGLESHAWNALPVESPASPGLHPFLGDKIQCNPSITGPAPMRPDRETSEDRITGQRFVGGLPRTWSVSFNVLILASACIFLPHAHDVAQAETPEEKGLRIARDASARNEGFGDVSGKRSPDAFQGAGSRRRRGQDFTAGMKMVLRDRQGRESVRQMRFKVLEVAGDACGERRC